MNVNWKEAILQAQKKIDRVLDIRPETLEVEADQPQDETLEDNCSSPSQGSEPLADDIVMLEPVLPPFLNSRYIGDDIQTIISSDIEHLTRASSRTASPERPKILMEFDTEASLPQAAPESVLIPAPAVFPDVNYANSEDILNQAINGLRKELNEYKKANQMLQSSQASLEREIEENRFSANEQVVNMLTEEREHFNQEISQLKNTCSQVMTEKNEIEEKYKNSTDHWAHTKDVLQYFRSQMSQIKSSLQKTEENYVSDFQAFGAEIKRTLENQVNRKQSWHKAPQVLKMPCNCETRSKENQVVKHEQSTQTDIDYQEKQENNQRYEREVKNNASTSAVDKTKGTVTDLLQIIEQLEIEKKQLLSKRRNDRQEIENLQQQLNETLVMHGEKIEQLDEIMVDNEELKSILKQQALALTNNKI